MSTIDWERLVWDLRGRGLSFRGIAHGAELSTTAVVRFGEGTEPRHADGERLIALWCSVSSSSREQLPSV